MSRLLSYINESREQLKQWQQYVKSNPMLSSAVKVLEKINKKGYKAYIVGGAVRDVVIGTEPKDIDIAVNCGPEILSSLWKLYPIGNSGNFGIWLIKEGGYSFEVAMLRGESYKIPKYVRKILEK
jgi:tRNA nucleotidyltransferase/poly(A) polymerase